MHALPAQHEVGELGGRTGDDLTPQKGQAAALHTVQVFRGGPLQRLHFTAPHWDDAPAALPLHCRSAQPGSNG